MLDTVGQESDVGGAIAACIEHNVEPVPLLFVSAQPSGTIDHETYQAFQSRRFSEA